jgi:hypothetical protein
MRLVKAPHLRRLAGRPKKNTQASVAPPLATHQVEALIALVVVTEATMLNVAVVFPFTVTDAGFRLHVIPLGAAQVRATELLNPLIEPRPSVSVPVAPAAIVTVGVCAIIEKSDRGFDRDNVVADGAYVVSPPYVITTELLPWTSDDESSE